MKVLQINSVYAKGSTGRIVKDCEDLFSTLGIETYVITGEDKFSSEKIFVTNTPLTQKFNILLTRLFGRHGFYNRFSTKRAMKFIDKVSPDIVHLHNIHGHYINIDILFKHLRKRNIPVVWTLHDSWAFTGHCSHFDYAGCDRWKHSCGNCPLRRSYPDSWFFDRSKRNLKDKRRLFTSIEKMHVVTPSNWLGSLAKESFLNKYPITTVHNGIDTKAFAPVETDLRERLGLQGKFLLLGIVSSLSGTKGGQYFLELSKMLKEDEHIVLLSLEDTSISLPKNITALPRTNSVKELSEVYSMADVFINPTLQDTFSMINVEALACAVPVVTFRTGGCAESLTEKCGIVVQKGDAKALYEGVEQVRQGRIKKEDCRNRGLEFDHKIKFSEYIDIYKDLIK